MGDRCAVYVTCGKNDSEKFEQEGFVHETLNDDNDTIVRLWDEQANFAATASLEALAGLGLGPGQAIALEDSPNGVTAAKRAGLFCVAVPNAMTDGLPLDHADLRLASLAELSLAGLILHLQAGPHRR